MKRHQNLLVDSLLQNKIISAEEAEIYQFGIECFLLKAVNCLSYLIIAVLMEMLLELLVMGGILIPLRRSAGGYHAKTKVGCYIFSCVVVAAALFVCRVLSMHYVWYAMLFFANFLVFFLAPVDNKNKIMDTAEKRYFREKTLKVLLAANLACFLAILIGSKQLYGPAIMGVFVAGLLIVLGKRKNFI